MVESYPKFIQVRTTGSVTDVSLAQKANEARQPERGCSVEESIEVLVDVHRVERLMVRHGLDRSTATQIVQGRLCIDKFLHRRRRKAHLKKYRDRSIFEKALNDGRPRMFALHGQRVIIARVMSVRSYEVEVLHLGPDLRSTGECERIHKLQFKFGAYFDHAQRMHKEISICSDSNDVAMPVPKPQDRYAVSDKKLFGWVDAKSHICVKTLEGELVTAPLSWIGRWEIGLNVEGVELVVFRHALANIQGKKWAFSKAD